jgi:membrane-anchored protein YejM (alkaline phosphatase superfamily)
MYKSKVLVPPERLGAHEVHLRTMGLSSRLLYLWQDAEMSKAIVLPLGAYYLYYTRTTSSLHPRASPPRKLSG